MNKQELKKILKPLIKECIKEVIFEDGVLSSVISEVMIAAGPRTQSPSPQTNTQKAPKRQTNAKLQEQRKQMLDAIGRDAFNGVNIFEGTTPAPAAGSTSQQGPLSGQAPNDPGVDISDFANSGVWKKLAGN
tara:strand:+ start:1108 stop:1503 length:396 start_codon:yes stop_codon:yes gene_type:complete